MLPNRSCPACTGPTRQTFDPWHFECPACGYEFSTLEPVIDSPGSAIDEAKRETALKALRESNFRLLTERLQACGLVAGCTVLDVGCAHGWFLQALSAQGYKAVGIEPDRAMAGFAKASGQEVLDGFFPGDLPADARYDAITFNDVFEHLPDVDAVAGHCFSRLHRQGLLLINAPTTGGILFRIAKALRRLGLNFAWDRLWQKGLPSPHLSYFSAVSLRAIARRNGFSEVAHFAIPAEQAAGSWQRIRYTGMALPVAAAIWLALLVARPVLRLFPSDAVVFIFRKNR